MPGSRWKPSRRRGFNVLVLDAFSGDAIPTHLLTREAFDVYLRHLAPKGVIAVHISNRHLNLAPVVRQAAEYCGMKCSRICDQRRPPPVDRRQRLGAGDAKCRLPRKAPVDVHSEPRRCRGAALDRRLQQPLPDPQRQLLAETELVDAAGRRRTISRTGQRLNRVGLTGATGGLSTRVLALADKLPVAPNV